MTVVRSVVVLMMFARAGTATAVAAPVMVVDDSGREVHLPRPAKRIVSLAPHVTETLFEAGAGDLIVGAVTHSDFPDEARRIPRVGDSSLLDLERIVALRPDLIVAWFHGNAESHLAKVRALGIPMYHSRPKALSDIASSLLRMGEIAGTERTARPAAAAYTARLEALRVKYAARPPVPIFYQVWTKPLLTINREQIISDVIRLCGGRNIFEEAELLVPTVDVEAVAAANPEAIVTTGTGRKDAEIFDAWRKLPNLRATASGNLLLIRTETLGRHSPRILDGATMLCSALDGVRARRRS